MPKDCPLPPEKTDARPLGVLNVNEGSKKGLISVLEELQTKSTLERQDWASKTRIIQGDWLTSNNFRAACRERKDDITPFHRHEYVEEISALWHFGLNATHMIVRTHFGVAVTDPTSLAAHKGLLRRTWDAKKPNYAAAKSLIRHSLIARILHCVMYVLVYIPLCRARPDVNTYTISRYIGSSKSFPPGVTCQNGRLRTTRSARSQSISKRTSHALLPLVVPVARAMIGRPTKYISCVMPCCSVYSSMQSVRLMQALCYVSSSTGPSASEAQASTTMLVNVSRSWSAGSMSSLKSFVELSNEHGSSIGGGSRAGGSRQTCTSNSVTFG